ncbi:putative inhibitor of apoptosis [Saccostrea echinata]|uniref:putative inhibitor of apoptosis n=1 Tax=Saccostrea echinata TaxID=191078 RepID=UPI002A813395|nr:putative inhibitor of apoptosis [Saccostrea echinata]
MNMEMIRISTFSNFPQTTSVSTVRLAKEGFYYTGEGDNVACFACGLHRDGWRAADDPREIHIQLSPNCPFLNSCQSENVPIQEGENIGSSQMEIQPRGDSGESTSGHVIQTGEGNILQNSTLSMSNNEIRLRENTGYSVPTYSASNSSQQEDEFNLKSLERQEKERPHQRSRALQEKINVFLRSLDPLGINFDRPKYPAYAVVATRVSSFNDWPSSITQTPRDLALAGFLYVGYGDYTRCFFCGGGLCNWEPGDDPWIEHARWFPKCAFLRQNKGDEFVALVQIEHDEMEASEEAKNAEEGATSTKCRSNNKSTGTEEKNTTASDIFDLVSVQSVLEMGYTRQAVKEAFDLLRMTKHVEEISGEDLIDVILSKEENSTRPDIQSATHNSEPKLLEGNDTGYTNESTKKEDNSNIGSTSGAKDSPSTIGSLDSSNNSLSSFSIEDTKSLIEENRKLKDLRLCKICLENDASIAMLPCGHLCCCPDCAPAMRKCPICRQFVKGTVRTWLV